MATRNRTWKEQRDERVAKMVYERQQTTYMICFVFVLIVALFTGGLGE